MKTFSIIVATVALVFFVNDAAEAQHFHRHGHHGHGWGGSAVNVQIGRGFGGYPGFHPAHHRHFHPGFVHPGFVQPGFGGFYQPFVPVHPGFGYGGFNNGIHVQVGIPPRVTLVYQPKG